MTLSVEIHMVNVGHGDALVIAIRDNGEVVRTIMIDSGNKNNDMVLQYMRHQGLREEDDVSLYVATHYHADHVNGSAQLLRDARDPIVKAVVDIGGYVASDGVQRVPFHSVYNDAQAYYTAIAAKFPQLATSPFFIQGGSAPSEPLLVYPEDPAEQDKSSVTLWCVSGAGYVAFPAPGGSWVTRDALATLPTPDINEMSIGVLLEFRHGGDIRRFFSAGDLGPITADALGSLINDYKIVTPGFHVDVFKANHHGSLNNNPERLLRALAPRHVLIPSASPWYLPNADFFRRLATFVPDCETIYMTNRHRMKVPADLMEYLSNHAKYHMSGTLDEAYFSGSNSGLRAIFCVDEDNSIRLQIDQIQIPGQIHTSSLRLPPGTYLTYPKISPHIYKFFRWKFSLIYGEKGKKFLDFVYDIDRKDLDFWHPNFSRYMECDFEFKDEKFIKMAAKETFFHILLSRYGFSGPASVTRAFENYQDLGVSGEDYKPYDPFYEPVKSDFKNEADFKVGKANTALSRAIYSVSSDNKRSRPLRWLPKSSVFSRAVANPGKNEVSKTQLDHIFSENVYGRSLGNLFRLINPK